MNLCSTSPWFARSPLYDGLYRSPPSSVDTRLPTASASIPSLCLVSPVEKLLCYTRPSFTVFRDLVRSFETQLRLRRLRVCQHRISGSSASIASLRPFPRPSVYVTTTHPSPPTTSPITTNSTTPTPTEFPSRSQTKQLPFLTLSLPAHSLPTPQPTNDFPRRLELTHPSPPTTSQPEAALFGYEFLGFGGLSDS
ncbi:hypothetical protein G7K_5900-t1 [Saitoella complicata NRRL Y-17804]|uniref:Uncharacterized protein n=1 Tax=Saitoella complicata (strain BCRC 22490 / CBS 7301 / JCM 7358 / NBRC 10748 / NRRL Y-17804) TaxID=698492 RepID=A0A0E9NPP0_SAICN|nr:hypothetical protein G7K_5900-t1 [Saitoella complicata NRRL Y-17804]